MWIWNTFLRQEHSRQIREELVENFKSKLGYNKYPKHWTPNRLQFIIWTWREDGPTSSYQDTEINICLLTAQVLLILSTNLAFKSKWREETCWKKHIGCLWVRWPPYYLCFCMIIFHYFHSYHLSFPPALEFKLGSCRTNLASNTTSETSWVIHFWDTSADCQYHRMVQVERAEV